MPCLDSLGFAGRRLSTRSWIARSRRAVVSAARAKRPFSRVSDRVMDCSFTQDALALNPRADSRVPPPAHSPLVASPAPVKPWAGLASYLPDRRLPHGKQTPA